MISGRSIFHVPISIGVSLSALACLLLLLAVGCSGNKDIPPLRTVTGLVTLDGKPLADANVAFAPEHGRTSIGRTDAAGRYELYFDGPNKGAAVGRHRVIITTMPSMDSAHPIFVPARYNVQTTLTAEVKPGKNTFDFALQLK